MRHESDSSIRANRTVIFLHYATQWCASICALTSVSFFIWGAFRRVVGVLLSWGRRIQTHRIKTGSKGSSQAFFFFFFSSVHLQGNKICTRWEWATRVFHSHRLHKLRRLLKECCGWCCVALPVANTVNSSKQITTSFGSFFNWNTMRTVDWVTGKPPTFCIWGKRASYWSSTLSIELFEFTAELHCVVALLWRLSSSRADAMIGQTPCSGNSRQKSRCTMSDWLKFTAEMLQSTNENVQTIPKAVELAVVVSKDRSEQKDMSHKALLLWRS